MSEVAWQGWVTLWLFCPLFAVIAWTDLTKFRIPNSYCIAGAALFLVSMPFLAFDEILLRLVVAALCFAICFGLFAISWLGGGDAKMMPIVMLAIPTPVLSNYMFLLAFTMAFGLIALAACRKRIKQPSPVFEATIHSQKFPVGIAIGSSGLILAGWSLYLISA